MGKYRFPPFFVLDTDKRELQRSGDPVHLHPMTIAVLCYLVERAVENPKKFVSYHELIKNIWRIKVHERAPASCVKELRHALLGDNARKPRFIETAPRGQKAYRFIAPITREEASLRPVLLPGSPPPHMVGRAKELNILLQLLRKAEDGVPQIAFITGEPGIGKTALVNTFLSQTVTDTTFRITHGCCDQNYKSLESLTPILMAIGALCETSERELLIEQLRRSAPMVLSQLTAVLSPTEQADLQRQFLGVVEQRLPRDIAMFLHVLATDRGLVLVLEDLHWSDASTVALLSLLARRLEPARLLLIGTYRPVEILANEHPFKALHQELVSHNQCTEIPLEGLTITEITEYLQQRFRRNDLSTRLSQVMYRRTEGNPLFLVTMAGEVEESNITLPEDQTDTLQSLSLSRDLNGVPKSLRPLITKQIERLDHEEREILEAASVVGRNFSAADVAPMVGKDLVEIEKHCSELVRQQQFLQPAGFSEWPDGTVASSFGFQHAIHHFLWQERVGAGQWQRWQRHLAEHKEQAYGKSARVIAAELAIRFEQGRNFTQAIKYYQQAAESAFLKSAYREALDWITKGLSLLDTLRASETPPNDEKELELALRRVQARALMLTQGYSSDVVKDAHEHVLQLVMQVGSLTDQFDSQWGLWGLYQTRGEYDTALTYARNLHTLAKEHEDVGFRVEAETVLGFNLVYLGEFKSSREHFARAIAQYDHKFLEDHRFRYTLDPKVLSLAQRTWSLWALGDPEQANQSASGAVHFATKLKHHPSIAFAQHYKALLHLFLRENEEAEKLAYKNWRFALGEGLAIFIGMEQMIYGGALVAQAGSKERLHDGIKQIQEGLTCHEQIGARIGNTYWRWLLADAYARAECVQEALREIDTAFQLVQQRGERWWEAELYRFMGEMLCVQESRGVKIGIPNSCELHVHGRESNAENYFLTAHQIAHSQEAASLELRAAMSLTRLWRQREKATEAHKMLEEIYRQFTAGFDTADLQEAKRLLTELT